MKTGVVQGGVQSPVLFNYYLADFPTPTGVVQGGVLSPVLFNYYLADFPTTTGVVQGGVLSPVLFNDYLADFPTPKGEDRSDTRRSSVSSTFQLLSGRLFNTDR